MTVKKLARNDLCMGIKKAKKKRPVLPVYHESDHTYLAKRTNWLSGEKTNLPPDKNDQLYMLTISDLSV